MEKKENKLSLVESIKSKLREADKAVASHIDFSKSDEEIISGMESAELLKFNKHENKDD